MKITSFNPLIVTPNGQEIIKLFEELGFEKRHQVDNVDDKDITNVSMADANGFHIDVANAPNMDRDLTAIRMNVDNFEEVHEFLSSLGFTSPTPVVESESAKSVLMVSPSGFGFDLCHHIKKNA